MSSLGISRYVCDVVEATNEDAYIGIVLPVTIESILGFVPLLAQLRDCSCLRHRRDDLKIRAIIWDNIWMGANIGIMLPAAIGSVLESEPLSRQHTNTSLLGL